MYLPSGTIVGFSAHYNTKHLLTKPLHYLIQIFTGSKLHHVGIMCDGLLYEAMAKTGVREISLTGKLGEIDDCVDVIIFKPTYRLTPQKLIDFRIDIYNQLGKQYPKWQALLSILTAILLLDLRKSKPKSKEHFCSKLIVYAYKNIFPAILERILPRTFNPEESIKTLRAAGLIQEGEILKR